MAHGFSATKEMYLDKYAERFCDNGFAVLVFDYRFMGESDGSPRGQLFPELQIEDYRNAISFVSQLPEVNKDRIGIWGSSYSGGHVLHIAAFDKRVKAVVSQVPLVDGYKNAQRLMRADVLQGFIQSLIEYRQARYNKGEVSYLPVVAKQGEPCALPTPDSYEWFIETGNTIAPTWQNQVTLESMEKFVEYEPARAIELISPTPLRMVVATEDTLTPTDLAISAFEEALEPKSLILVKGGHFDAYTNGFEDASQAAVDWFKEYL
jgi:fermentation-respiration switch protein FrsA (DUF1100 family)